MDQHDSQGQTALQSRRRLEERCDFCMASAGMDGGGISLAPYDGLRDVIYTTDAVAAAVEVAQAEIGEGPGVDASRSRTPVVLDDFSAPDGGVDQRWPFFRAQTSDLGLRALYAFPIRDGAVGFGTLGLYRLQPGTLDRRQLEVATSAVSAMGEDLVMLAGGDSWRVEAPSSHIHQAAGMAMVQLDSSISDALARLRSTAFAQELSLRGMADLIIDGSYRFTSEAP